MKGPELIYAYQPLVALLSRSTGIRRMSHTEKISGPCFSLVGLEKLCRMVHLGITQSWYQQSMNQIHYCCFSAYGIFRYVKPSTTYEFVELQNTSCWALVEWFHIFLYRKYNSDGLSKGIRMKVHFWNLRRKSFKYFQNFLFWLLKVCFPPMLILWEVCLVHKIRILHHSSPRSLLILAFSNQEWNEITSRLEFCLKWKRNFEIVV